MQIFNQRAQNVMEYTLLMAGAVALSIVALRQGGLVDKKVTQSLDISVSGVECMALNTCYDPNGCPVTCGNGCCETHGETAGSCWADCECANPAECDDGVYCNGVEECGGNQHCRYGPSLSAGTDAGLCVECDGGGGERAVIDDPDCGTIDCGGNNYFHHTGPTADATDVETCFLREFAAITSGRCDGIRKCKNPDSANCMAYGDKTEYFCDTCKYIAASDCTGTFLGGCSNSDTSSVCGTRVCDLNDVACRDYHDVTRYCDGGGNCATPACDSYTNQDTSTTCGTEDCDYLDAVTACRDYQDVTKYCDGLGGCATPACDDFTNAAAGVIVKLCTECDGGGAERAAPDDNACGVLACSDLSYYEQTGIESPVDTEICNYYAYTNMLTDRCEGMNDCKDVGVVGATDCAVPAPAESYRCGRCLRIVDGEDCFLKNKGGCTPYAAETRTDICRVCDGTIAGGEKMPAPGHNETGCGTGGNIECDGLDGYYASGTKSATATEYCDYWNYDDITSDQCEGVGNCKDPDSPDCTAYTVNPSGYSQLTCDTCQKLKAGTCTADTDVPGECENYPDTEYTAYCTVCSGTGPTTKAAVGDSRCGTIMCTALPSTYSTTSTNSAMVEEVCDEKRYQTNISTDNCKPVGDGTTGVCKEANTTDCVPSPYQMTCKMCEYLTGCSGTTPGSCSPYAAGTSCGGDSVCDGSGNCALQQCLAAPMAVSVNGLTGNFTATDVGSSATSTCPSGYSGSPTRWCNAVANAANGSWGSLQTPCMRNCQAGNQAVGAEGQTGWFGETSVGQTATSSCPSGSANNSNGPPYRSCNADSNNDGFGEWGSLQNACVPNSCGATLTVSNATPSETGTFPHTTVKTVTCNTGCAGGSKNIQCDFGTWKWVESNGTLSNTALTCSGIDGSWGPTWTDVGSCTSCSQQQQGTCSATCGGLCPADAANGITASGLRNVACDGFCCGNGCSSMLGETCLTCPDDCLAPLVTGLVKGNTVLCMTPLDRSRGGTGWRSARPDAICPSGYVAVDDHCPEGASYYSNSGGCYEPDATPGFSRCYYMCAKACGDGCLQCPTGELQFVRSNSADDNCSTYSYPSCDGRGVWTCSSLSSSCEYAYTYSMGAWCEIYRCN